MSRNELKTKAEGFRRQAEKATSEGMRTVYLKLARSYYAEAGYDGLARYIERFLG